MDRRAEKRAGIVEAVSAHLLERGLGETGVRRLAEVAGTSDRMLLYYFETKEELLAAALAAIATGIADAIAALLGGQPLPPARAAEAIWAMAKETQPTRGLRLWLELSSRAGRGDATCRDVVERIRSDWVDWIGGLLDVPEAERDALAALVMACVDGQLVLHPDDPSRGDAAMRAFVALLERPD